MRTSELSTILLIFRLLEKFFDKRESSTNEKRRKYLKSDNEAVIYMTMTHAHKYVCTYESLEYRTLQRCIKYYDTREKYLLAYGKK